MRVKTGVVRRRKHKKILKRTKGMRMSKGTLIKVSKEADLHKGHYQYVGRKLRKRDMRKLWIQRINAGLKMIDEKLKYSKFINALKVKEVKLNRKVLADMVVRDFDAFKEVVKFTNS